MKKTVAKKSLSLAKSKKGKNLYSGVSTLILLALIVGTILLPSQDTLKATPASSAEFLADRAVVAIDLAGNKGASTLVSAADVTGAEYTSGVYLSWRRFEGEPEGTTYAVFREDEIIADNLIQTNFIDLEGDSNSHYRVQGSSDNLLGLSTKETAVWGNQYLELSLQKPLDQTMPDGTSCFYNSNDLSVGDLDGDGQYELIVKWMPSNSQDNSKSGYTGTTILDGYKLDLSTGAASLMWRIDLGVNIRSGAHYTQFQVWDFDQDGKAEIAVKTADGSTSFKSQDGTAEDLLQQSFIGACASSALPTEAVSAQHDYRNSSGYVLDGPEYFTIFDGESGLVKATTEYLPSRGSVAAWGDAYGNRVDRFLSAVAYLDGETPYAVFCRGYYTRTTLTAYRLVDTNSDGVGDSLEVYWNFDTNDIVGGNQYTGQGNHGLSVNDVDGDGRDEIIYGAITINDDGSLLYATGLGHGDAMHVSDWVAWNAGLEIMSVHETKTVPYHVEIHDAASGEVLMGYYTGVDTGRGAAGDIDPTSPGGEFWSGVLPNNSGGQAGWNSKAGAVFATTSRIDNLIKLSDKNPAVNFTLFWDGDLLSETFDHSFNEGAYLPISANIAKWDYQKGEEVLLFESSEVWTNNGTKGNPGLIADILGDWREEVIVRRAGGATASSDDNKIRIYATTIPTDYVVPCLMTNRAYREGIAWQNVAYNQPANLSYLLSEGVITAQISFETVKSDQLDLVFTPASDGVYGHSITGYSIYRSENDGAFEKIAAIPLDELEQRPEGFLFHDTSLKSATTYKYQIAAQVNQRDSYLSETAQVQTKIAIKSVPEIVLDPLVQNTPLGEGKTVASLLPEQVHVINSEDQTVLAPVEWDVTGVDITTVGTYRVSAEIDGWETVIPVDLVVLENIITGYRQPDKIRAVQHLQPILPETITVTYLNGTSIEQTVLWDVTDFDIATIGSYTINGQLPEVSNYPVSIEIEVGENYITEVPPLKLQVNRKTNKDEIIWPAVVTANFADGTSREVTVIWDTSSVDTSVVGAQIFQGQVDGFAEGAQLTLEVVYKTLWQFDFGIASAQVETGWTGITVNPKNGTRTTQQLDIHYTPEKGFGFASAEAVIEGRDEGVYIEKDLLPSKVYRDFVLPGTNGFIADVPKGIYEVDISAGSLYSGKVVVTIENNSKSSISNGAGDYNLQTFIVQVDDGQMNFLFDSGNTHRLNAIVIRYMRGLPGDKTELTARVDVLKALSSEVYTEESWIPFHEVLEAAKALLADEEAEQEALGAVLAALEQAYAALEEEIIVTPEPTLTPEPTITPTEVPTVTPEPTITPTETPTVTPEPTITPTIAPTIVPTTTPSPTPIPTTPPTAPTTAATETSIEPTQASTTAASESQSPTSGEPQPTATQGSKSVLPRSRGTVQNAPINSVEETSGTVSSGAVIDVPSEPSMSSPTSAMTSEGKVMDETKKTEELLTGQEIEPIRETDDTSNLPFILAGIAIILIGGSITGIIILKRRK